MITILEAGIYLLMIGSLICGSTIVIAFGIFMMNIYNNDKPLFIFMIGLIFLFFDSICMAIYQFLYI